MLLPPYLAYLKILHLLDQTIVLVIQHSLLIVYYLPCQHHFLRIVPFAEQVLRGLVRTLFVVWLVVLITCHAALTMLAVVK